MKIRTLVWLLLLSTAFASEDIIHQVPFSSLEIPPAPGCIIKLYGPLPTDGIAKEIKKAGSLKTLLESQGVTFPEHGYVLFDPTSKCVIAATSADQQEVIQTLLTPF